MRFIVLAALATTALYSQEETPDHRLRTSTDVLHETMSAPDKGIPKDLLGKAQCVVIVPALKKAPFVFGGESTDVVMLVMSRRGMEKLATDKFTLGGDESAAAGPVGRTAEAETDLQLHAEILSYSRTRGAFAGAALDGTVVSADGSEDRKLYGRDVDNKTILEGALPSPDGAKRLTAELGRYSLGR
jgi:lipid-binding SYLF domain-containing protein